MAKNLTARRAEWGEGPLFGSEGLDASESCDKPMQLATAPDGAWYRDARRVSWPRPDPGTIRDREVVLHRG